MPYLRGKNNNSYINRHDFRLFERILESFHDKKALAPLLLRAEIHGLSVDVIKRYLDPDYE